MTTRTLDMTQKEVQILLGVRLMYWGVPFLVAHKMSRTEADETMGDDVWARLLALRDAAKVAIDKHGNDGASHSVTPFVRLPLSKSEAGMYIEMTRACLEECGMSEIDLSIHLSTRTKEHVERLLVRLSEFEQAR